MVDGTNNFIQVFNEVIILVCTWYLFLFTEYVPNPVDRHLFGQGFIYLIGFNCTINILLLIFLLCKSIKAAIKTKFAKRTSILKVRPTDFKNSNRVKTKKSVTWALDLPVRVDAPDKECGDQKPVQSPSSSSSSYESSSENSSEFGEV